MSCTIVINRHGVLTFRIYFRGREYWKSTGKKDTAENRKYVEALAVVISNAIADGSFSLDWFQETEEAKRDRRTVGGYYAEWIERKKPPMVRAGLERDYKEHFGRYILPRFRNVALLDVTARRLEEFRGYLLNERGLSMKTVRNVVGATFRACLRDARKVDALLDKDPFEALTWPRIQLQRPDPFTEQERDAILVAFAKHSPFYVPFAHVLFWTGARPSELLALRWGDIDLRGGFLTISKSRYKDTEGAPKTTGSERSIKLLPSVVEALNRLKPLHVTESNYVFLNQEGQPLNFHTWRGGVWYRILRGASIRERKPYACRHTFISVGLSKGVSIKWLAEYCGTSVAMIEKHYGRYVKNDAAEQLSKLVAVTPEKKQRAAAGEAVEKAGKKGWWAHLDSNQGPTGYEPVALTN